MKKTYLFRNIAFTTALASILMPSSAHAFYFMYNIDYANVSQIGTDPIQPGTTAAQGFKINFVAIGGGGGSPKIELLNSLRTYPVHYRSPALPTNPLSPFPAFVNTDATLLTGPHEIINNKSRSVTAFYKAADITQTVSRTGFIHTFTEGCADANYIKFAEESFTNSQGIPVGIPNFALPSFGHSSTNSGTCPPVVQFGPWIVLEISQMIPNLGFSGALSSLQAQDGSVGGAISYLQVLDDGSPITLLNTSSESMEFGIRFQMVQEMVEGPNLNGDNPSLVKGFGTPTIVTLAPGQEIVVQAASVPEPSSTLSLLALGTLGAASTLKRKLKPSKSTEKEPTKVG